VRKRASTEIIKSEITIVCAVHDPGCLPVLAKSVASIFDSGIRNIVVVDSGNNEPHIVDILRSVPWKTAHYYGVSGGKLGFSRSKLINYGVARVSTRFIMVSNADNILVPQLINSVCETLARAASSMVVIPVRYVSATDTESFMSKECRATELPAMITKSDDSIPDSGEPMVSPSSPFVCGRYDYCSSGGFDCTLGSVSFEMEDLKGRWKQQGRDIVYADGYSHHLYHAEREHVNNTKAAAVGTDDVVQFSYLAVEGVSFVDCAIKPVATVIVKKNILICGETLGLGGAEKMTVDIANSLNRSGRFNVEVVLTVSRNGIFKDRLDGGIPVSLVTSTKGLTDIVCEHKPDAVLVNNCRIATQCIRDITNRHKPDYIGVLLHGFNEWTMRMVPDELDDVITDIVTISHEAAGGIIGKKPAYKGRLAVFENYVDTDIFTKSSGARTIFNKYGWPDDSFVFSYMGRFSGEKSLVPLVETFKRVLTRNKKARLLMIGGSDPGVQSYKGYWDSNIRVITDYIKQIGVEQEVKITGVVKDPWTYLNETDVLVMSSQFEGVPLALLEAMSCEVPFISTDVGSVSRFSNAGAGVVVKKVGPDMNDGERSEFAGHMLSAMRNQPRGIAMGKVGREYIERFHSLNEYSSKISRYFCNAVSGDGTTNSDRACDRIVDPIVI